MRRLAGIVAAVLLATGPAIFLAMDDEAPSGSLQERLVAMGVSAPAGNFTTVSTETDTVAGITVRRLTASDGDRLVRAELLPDVGEEFARTYLQDRRSEVISLYTESQEPYAGLQLREVECPEEFRPQVERLADAGTNVTVYTVYADADRNIGVCSADAVAYRATLVTGYCPAHDTVLDVELFRPVNGSDQGVYPARIECL